MAPCIVWPLGPQGHDLRGGPAEVAIAEVVAIRSIVRTKLTLERLEERLV